MNAQGIIALVVALGSVLGAFISAFFVLKGSGLPPGSGGGMMDALKSAGIARDVGDLEVLRMEARNSLLPYAIGLAAAAGAALLCLGAGAMFFPDTRPVSNPAFWVWLVAVAVSAWFGTGLMFRLFVLMLA